jgi:hypothetical protein
VSKENGEDFDGLIANLSEGAQSWLIVRLEIKVPFSCSLQPEPRALFSPPHLTAFACTEKFGGSRKTLLRSSPVIH